MGDGRKTKDFEPEEGKTVGRYKGRLYSIIQYGLKWSWHVGDNARVNLDTRDDAIHFAKQFIRTPLG